MTQNTINDEKILSIYKNVKFELEFVLSDFFHCEMNYDYLNDFIDKYNKMTKNGYSLGNREAVLKEFNQRAIELLNHINQILIEIECLKKNYYHEFNEKKQNGYLDVKDPVFSVKKKMSLGEFFELSYNISDVYEIRLEEIKQNVKIISNTFKKLLG